MGGSKSRNLYGVYDLRDNETCIGIMTARELADYVGIQSESVYKAAYRNKKPFIIKNRYEVKAFQQGDIDF